MRTIRLVGMVALALALACGAAAQTRVRDTLFTAAGNRAEGSCVVQWPSFTTAQAVAVPAGTRLVVIRSGLLDITLQPSVGATPPGTVYQARCSFAGSVPGPWEQWDVPYSATPVGLAQVRVNPTAPPSPGLIISSVAGLQTALDARPVRAPEWQVGRTARITADGQLAAVAGASSNCVRVDGSSAPCAEGGGGTAAWGNIAGVLSEQADLQTALDAKAATTALTDGLNGKANAAHTHGVSDLTATGTPSATTYLRGDNVWATPEGSGGANWGGISGTLASQTDLQTALDAKAATGHGHAIGDVTNLQSALDGKAATSHGHAIADTSGLQDALNAKAEQGPGWTPSRAARIDANGALTAVSGSTTDCVRVDGSSAPCAEGGGGSSTLEGLSDVDATGITAGQALCKNTVSGNYEPCEIGGTIEFEVGNDLYSGQRVRFLNGPGIDFILIPDAQLNVLQIGVNTASMLSQATAQAGTPWLCETASASGSAYQCNPLPIISTLTRGMVLHFVPDVAPASGQITLQIWALDAVPVKQADGVTDPGVSAWSAGQMLQVWYDGSVFRLPSAGSSGGGGGGGEAIWGGITGTLANQADLQAALDGKAATGHGHAIADVTNLQTALDARPQAAAGYTPNRAARIDADGNLTAVSGSAADCVRVDGSSAPCAAGGGGTGPGWYQAALTFPEIPDGSCVAQSFTATGVAAGSTIAFSPPTGLAAEFTHTASAPAADTIRIQLCNFSGDELTPAAGLTYTARDLTPLGWLRGQAVLSFGPVPDGSCSAEQTFSLAPVATSDLVVPGWPAMLPGMAGQMRISGTDTIAVKVCNHSGAEDSPGVDLTFRATVIK